MEKTVYLISRYSAKTKREIKKNVAAARAMARYIYENGCVPIVPHLYFTQFMNDSVRKERFDGTEYGLQALMASDMVLVYIVDGVVSKGMDAELKLALEIGKPITTFSLTEKQNKIFIRSRGGSSWN